MANYCGSDAFNFHQYVLLKESRSRARGGVLIIRPSMKLSCAIYDSIYRMIILICWFYHQKSVIFVISLCPYS